MLTIIQYPLETGIVIALVVYGLILAWSLLARLKWLPGVVVHPVHYVLTRLSRLPLIGRAVRATRRHPLSLGLVAAILVGALVPALAISLTLLLIALAVMAVMMVVGYVIVKGEGAELGEYEDDYVLFPGTDGKTIDLANHDYEWATARGRLPRA